MLIPIGAAGEALEGLTGARRGSVRASKEKAGVAEFLKRALDEAHASDARAAKATAKFALVTSHGEDWHTYTHTHTLATHLFRKGVRCVGGFTLAAALSLERALAAQGAAKVLRAVRGETLTASLHRDGAGFPTGSSATRLSFPSDGCGALASGGGGGSNGGVEGSGAQAMAAAQALLSMGGDGKDTNMLSLLFNF
ncbi:hypothetical protein T492DRAFT_833582 [Pavlovales sp. CCMP2436]|nr:hypothetical protein T492DRAFT_833582 [Pavlovales sp. CCMP2436]